MNKAWRIVTLKRQMQQSGIEMAGFDFDDFDFAFGDGLGFFFVVDGGLGVMASVLRFFNALVLQRR
jgi:hypothetical protein